MVEYHVEPEYLEAHRILQVIRLRRPIGVLQRGLHRDDGLGDHVLDFNPQQVSIHLRLALPDMLKYGGKTAFVPTGVLVLILVSLEVVVVLVDRVVRQVHKQVAQVALGGTHVFTGRKASQAFLEDEDAQRVDAIDEGVDAQVELVAVYDVGLVQVALSHVLLALLEVDVLELSHQEDSFALAEVDRLHDEGLYLLLGYIEELLFKVRAFLWQHPRLGDEGVVLLVHASHALDIPA